MPEADQHYTALGLDAGMMGYFGSRAAAMGPVQAEVVVATFFNFNPKAVHAVVPEVWRRASCAALWQARLAAVDAALGRILGRRLTEPDIARAADLLRGAVDACHPEGRPLFAGHVAQDWPVEPHLALWFGITLLREYRGDGHIARHGATGAVPPSVLQRTRAWSDDEWTAAQRGLLARGWLAADGTLTAVGSTHRDEVERRTDDLAAGPWARLSGDDAIWLAALGKDLSATIVAAGTFPGR